MLCLIVCLCNLRNQRSLELWSMTQGPNKLWVSLLLIARRWVCLHSCWIWPINTGNHHAISPSSKSVGVSFACHQRYSTELIDLKRVRRNEINNRIKKTNLGGVVSFRRWPDESELAKKFWKLETTAFSAHSLLTLQSEMEAGVTLRMRMFQCLFKHGMRKVDLKHQLVVEPLGSRESRGSTDTTVVKWLCVCVEVHFTSCNLHIPHSGVPWILHAR